jgi:hypothetical protein
MPNQVQDGDRYRCAAESCRRESSADRALDIEPTQEAVDSRGHRIEGDA